MRPIKFRAWDNTNKLWLRQEDFLIDSDGFVLLFDKERGNEVKGLIGKWRTADEEEIILMQFTGLTDRNGKEIYEGDVVKWGHIKGWSEENPIRKAELKFNPDIQFHSQVGVFKFGNFAYADEIDKHMEVIGDIYRNPELLNSAH